MNINELQHNSFVNLSWASDSVHKIFRYSRAYVYPDWKYKNTLLRLLLKQSCNDRIWCFSSLIECEMEWKLQTRTITTSPFVVGLLVVISSTGWNIVFQDK